MLCFEPDPTKAKVLYDAKVRRLCPGPTGGPGDAERTRGPGEDPGTRGGPGDQGRTRGDPETRGLSPKHGHTITLFFKSGINAKISVFVLIVVLLSDRNDVPDAR